MISRDQADKTAESIMASSRQDLNGRKEKVARRWLNRESAFFPALYGSLATLFAYNYFDNMTAALAIGVLAGWGLGSTTHRSK